MKRILLGFAISMLFSASLQAQDTLRPSFSFYQALQTVYPLFTLTEDTVLLEKQLNKYYSINAYKALLATDSLNLLEDSVVRNQLEQILELATQSYLAALYDKHQGKVRLTVTEHEVRAYYDMNQRFFAEPGSIDYIIASAKSTKSEASILGAFSQYLVMDSIRQEDVTKFENEEYFLTSEFNISLSPQFYLYAHFLDAKIKEVKGPIRYQDRFLYILPLRIQKETVPPFEQVQSICRERLLMEKQGARMQEIEQKALEMFPYRLSE